MCTLLIFIGLLNFIFVDCQELGVYGRALRGVEGRNVPISNSPGYNMTYIEKPENILLVPSISQNNEQKSRRHYKTNPKRTIQKIIKKNRTKKKYSMHLASIPSTPSPVKPDDVYAQDDQMWNDEGSTGQPNQRRKPRKYNLKVARYPTSYKYQGRKDYRRTKRETDRDDVYILKDFDEMEFLKADGNYDIVKSKVQKYW